jgi:diketogulonate reductase-like aldo/keto reductase
VNRDELFVTTKVWHDQLAPDALRRSFESSLRKLGLDHVDLYMIHWPSKDLDMVATLEALMSLRECSLTRAIGVYNFNLPMLGAPWKKSPRRSPACRSNITRSCRRRRCCPMCRARASR